MQDKELIIKAINNYDLYNPTQREVLKALMNISVDNIANITPKILADLLRVTPAVVYYNLTLLEKDNIIEKIDKDKKTSRYKIVDTQIDNLVKIFLNKQNLRELLNKL